MTVNRSRMEHEILAAKYVEDFWFDPEKNSFVIRKKTHHCRHDPPPWCSGCGAMRKADCKCGPIAEND